MQIRPRKRMGFLLIAIAPLFLWNADIAVFDLLPDVIGYSLIALGMSSLSYLNYHFEESAKRFNRMVALSAARLAYVLVLFGLVSHFERPTTILLGNFVFGVLELMALLPGYKHMFEGFLYGFVPSLVNIPANCVQGVAGIIIGVILIKAIEKTGAKID